MPQHTEEEILSRRATVARLYLQGKFQTDIAQMVGVSQSQVSQDIAAIRADWLASAMMDFNQKKADELAKLDVIEQTLWDAWFDSKKPIEKNTTKMRGKVDMKLPNGSQTPEHFDTTKHVENRLGDPRYMQAILSCVQKRCDLLGLDAPIKIANTNVEGQNIVRRRTWNIQDNTATGRVPAPDEEY